MAASRMEREPSYCRSALLLCRLFIIGGFVLDLAHAMPALGQDSSQTNFPAWDQLVQAQREDASQFRVAFPSFAANDLKSLGTGAEALGDLLDKYKALSSSFGGASHALTLFGDVWSGDWKPSTPEARLDLANAGLWVVNTGADYWASRGASIAPIWQFRPSFLENENLRLDASFSVASSAFEFGSAITSQIGEGRLLPNEEQRNGYAMGAQGLLAVEYTLGPGAAVAMKDLSSLRSMTFEGVAKNLSMGAAGFGARFGLMAALPDTLTLLDSRLERPFGSTMTVNEVTSMTDAATQGLVSFGVFAATRNANWANASAAIFGAAASEGRKWTFPLFDSKAQIIDAYSSYVQSRANLGQPAMGFTQFAGNNEAAMFSREERLQLDSLQAPFRGPQQAFVYKPPPNTSLQFSPSAPALVDRQTLRSLPSFYPPPPSPPRPLPTALTTSIQESTSQLMGMQYNNPPRGGVCMTSSYEVKADSDFGDGSPQQNADTQPQPPLPKTPDCTPQQKKKEN